MELADFQLDLARMWLAANWLSFLRGEWCEDVGQSFKLFFYVLFSGAPGALLFLWLTGALVKR